MKSQVLHRLTLLTLFHKTNKHGKYSVTVSGVESWTKIQKQLNTLLKDLSPSTIKTVASSFYLNSY